MNKLTQTIENTIYSFDPTEFLPIYEEGELANKGAFAAYKLRRGLQHLGHAAVVTIEAWDSAQQHLKAL